MTIFICSFSLNLDRKSGSDKPIDVLFCFPKAAFNNIQIRNHHSINTSYNKTSQTGTLSQQWNVVLLHLLGYISDDRFGADLKNQFCFNECGHRIRCGSRALLVCFHCFLCYFIVVTAVTALWMARVLGENSKGFLQFDLLPVDNVMSYNQHWHPLVDGKQNNNTVAVDSQLSPNTMTIYKNNLSTTFSLIWWFGYLLTQ